MAEFTSLTPMLKARSLAETIDFYTNTLGFTLKCQWPQDHPTWCHLRRGEAYLMFFADDESACAKPSDPNLTGVLYIRTDDVLTLHSQIKDRVKILWGPEVFPYGMREFAIEDCNGYSLSFGQPTDVPADGPPSL